ncbi:MAG: hypothetical protein ACRDRN_03280 [Sciscionella sp.]
MRNRPPPSERQRREVRAELRRQLDDRPMTDSAELAAVLDEHTPASGAGAAAVGVNG